jgi:type III secretion protein C
LKLFSRTCLLAIFSAAALSLATPVCSAATAAGPWAGKKFTYRAEGKRLVDVLQDFAASQSVPVVVDASIDGKVNGNFDLKPEEFLKAIERTYGLVWYFDGVTLFVYPSGAMQSKVFRLRGFDRSQIQQTLKSLGLGDPRFALRYDEAQQTLLAYGPPRHIELITTVIDSLDQGHGDRVDSSVRVVALRFATAGDRMSGGSSIAGLATTLNNMFAQGRRGTGLKAASLDAATKYVTERAPADKRTTMEQMFGVNQPADASDTAKRDPGRDPMRNKRAEALEKTDDDTSSARRPDARQDARSELPYFQAEEASNSIIVYSPPAKIKQYEDLIRQLDVPQDMIEIEATIIDVSSDEIDELGIDWQFSRTGRGSITVSPVGGGTSGNEPFGTLVGSNITTVVADAGRALLSRIRALEGNGKARIVSRPKVLGAANRTASMADKRTASVRVAGNLDAQLFSIEAGTSMQVLPQIHNFNGWSEVRMSLFIEDGSFQAEEVDKVPVVKRTEIRTEATVREGQSLLIGGISVESESRSKSGLPVLSRVPILGAAFSQQRTSALKSERLFLLTPKVIRASVAPPLGAIGMQRPAPADVPPAAEPQRAPNAPPPAVEPQRVSNAPSAARAPAECTAQYIALGLGATRCAAIR